MHNDFNVQSEEVYSEYWEFDEMFAAEPVPMKVSRSKPRNSRMATLKRNEGTLNRYRNAGIL